MAKTTTRRPLCIVIAGPNGAGKTTFAREFLLNDTRVIHFVNADVIASGLSPLRPEMVALAAGRIFLRELDRLAKARADVLRRFDRSWINFQQSYRLLADAWSVYDNSGRNPRLVERSS
jgi:predicted ABC-type ATPase